MPAWYWIAFGEDGPAFAIRVRGGRVDRAAPSARWAIGLPFDEVQRYYQRLGATVVALHIPGGSDASPAR